MAAQLKTVAPAGGKEAPPLTRNAFQQRLEELKIRVMEKALRDMDTTIRILRDWMKGK